MNVTVLLPSRGRPALLARSVASLLDLAADPAGVEVLVGVDEDDLTMGRTRPVLPPQARLVYFPVRHGYSQLHHYVNALAAQAAGDWLLLWNDDAIMKTAGWDAEITRHPQMVLLFPHNNHTCGQGWCCNVFPIWPRAWTAKLGHVSLNAQCDSWMQEVGVIAQAQYRAKIEVYHDRFDLTGNNRDATYRDSSQSYDRAGYYAPDMAALRARDGEIIKEMLCR